MVLPTVGPVDYPLPGYSLSLSIPVQNCFTMIFFLSFPPSLPLSLTHTRTPQERGPYSDDEDEWVETCETVVDMHAEQVAPWLITDSLVSDQDSLIMSRGWACRNHAARESDGVDLRLPSKDKTSSIVFEDFNLEAKARNWP